ncbi:MAG: hydroxymethylbilane synthase, partial [Candidatus Poribacteria bacterium]|nr:hydroxymethylbilane synthase [Candidatus Poribacteria bacterium]
MKQNITIGTRGSQLALWQAEYVRKRLNHHFPDCSIRLKIIKTTGDKIRDRSLVGLGKGVFTKEIELALLDGTIDLAVHSMKDLPTELPNGLGIAAIPTREDPRDVLITESGL